MKSQILMLSDTQVSHTICGGGRRYPTGGSTRISNSFNTVKVAAIVNVNNSTSKNINRAGFINNQDQELARWGGGGLSLSGVFQLSNSIAVQRNNIVVVQ